MSKRTGITPLTNADLGEVAGGCGEHRGQLPDMWQRGAEALHALAAGADAAFHAFTGTEHVEHHCNSESDHRGCSDRHDGDGDRGDGNGNGDWQEGGDRWRVEGEDGDDEEKQTEEDKKGWDEGKDWDEPADGMWT